MVAPGRCKVLQYPGPACSGQWLPIAIAVRLKAINQTKRKWGRRDGGFTAPASARYRQQRRNIMDCDFAGLVGRHNLSGERNGVQLVACTNKIDAVHTRSDQQQELRL